MKKAVFPFNLTVDGVPLRCQKLLQTVPGKWLVISGTWQQKPVLAKIFLSPIRGWMAFNRELHGTEMLFAAGVPTPAIIYAGHIKKSAAFVLLFEPLREAIPFHQSFGKSIPHLERLALLRKLIQTIAKQHQAGILQTDIQLKDFLFANNRLYTVNTGKLRKQKKPLNSKKSLTLLALLLVELNLTDMVLKQEVIAWYFQSRAWSLDPKLVGYLAKQEKNWQKKREKALRSHIFRTSDQFSAEKTVNHVWVCDNADLTDELAVFLNAPEYLFLTQTMRILKEDATTTVGVVQMGDRCLLVKRYNIKHVIHRLKRLLTKTRAKKSWENAHRLLFRGIQTPKPIAMIEKRRGIFRGVCYFIAEYVPGTTASDYFQPHHFDVTNGQVVAKEILRVLRTLRDQKIFHGDLKASNILVNERGIWLLDLDATRFYRSNLFFKRKDRKDSHRFMRNWQGKTMVKRLFTS